MVSTRFSRRSFVRSALTGTAALATAERGAFSPRAVSAQSEPVNLEFWTPANDPVGSEIIITLVDEFNNTVGQEQGIFVNTRIKPVPDDDNYVQYTTAMTSSGSPDVVMTYSYDPVVAWAANGFLQPLDDYVAELGLVESDFFPIAWSMINFGGHTWGLLQAFDFHQFWTNTAIHAGDPPKTFEELDALAAEYTTFDDSGNLVQAGFIPWMNYTGDIWNTMWGGSWYDHANRTWTIDTPENQRFLDWFLTYVDLYGGREKTDAMESAIPREYGDIFQYGVVAFALEGEWMPATIAKQGLPLEYLISHPPTALEVPYGTGVTIGGNPFLLPTNSPHPDEAAVFIQYMGSSDAVLAWCLPNSNIPPVQAAAFDPSFAEALPELEPWLAALKVGNMVPPNPSPQQPLFNELIGDTIDAVTYRTKTPAQALSDMARDMAAAVEEFQQSHPEWEGE
ncbi:MAG: extracellular solute-binding protein [Thermomicrobiales bacterium]|nr:extracellular solute-binding protein [Thermomicrobiales bacterium]